MVATSEALHFDLLHWPTLTYSCIFSRLPSIIRLLCLYRYLTCCIGLGLTWDYQSFTPMIVWDLSLHLYIKSSCEDVRNRRRIVSEV